MSSVSVIIAAAGNALRMNGISKQTALLAGKPVTAYSLEIFARMEEVTEIIISARSEDIGVMWDIADSFGGGKVKDVVEGGNTRQESVINAVRKISRDTGLIAVHDAARPLVSEDVIRRCIKDASVFGGAAPAVPVKDTLKTANGGLVTDTPDRSSLFAVQTPQIFQKKYFYDGVNFALEHGLDFTDDCQLAEAVGTKIFLTPSDYFNIKITTPEDIALAEALIMYRKSQG